MKKLLLWLVLGVFLGGGAMAISELLNVTACSGGSSCSVTNYNSNSTSIGHTIVKSATGVTDTWTDSTSSGTDNIDNVILSFRHNGDAGISNSWTITFRSEDAVTTYCTKTTAHVEVDTYVAINANSSCSWTPSRLDDLEVAFTNGDGSGPDTGYIYFAQLQVDYTEGAAVPPVISDVSSTIVNTTAVDITWTTDVSSNSSVDYGTTTALGNTEVNTTDVTSHTVYLRGLSPETTYYYNVSSCSADGCNTSATGAPFSFTTPVMDDPPLMAYSLQTSSGLDNVSGFDLTNTGVTVVTGYSGNAYNISANTGKARAANVTGFGTDSKNRTISFWAKCQDVANCWGGVGYFSMTLGDSVGGNWYNLALVAWGGNDVRLYVGNGSGQVSGSPTSITTSQSDGAWHHYVLMRSEEAATLTLWEDGSLLRNETLTDQSITDPNTFNIHSNSQGNVIPDSAQMFDEVCVFPRAITLEEVNDLASGADCTRLGVEAATDTCTYTSGDWNVDAADNCVITTDVDVGGNNVYVTGSGSFTVSTGSGRVHNFGRFRAIGGNVCKAIDGGRIG